MLQQAPESLADRVPRLGEGMPLVVAAMPEELRPLLRRTGGRAITRIGSMRVFKGVFRGVPLLMARTGVGSTRAERGVRALLETFPVKVLLGIGVSGGLSPGLTEGTLLVGGEVFGPSGKLPGPDPAWFRAAVNRRSLRPGILVSVREIVPSREQKAALLSTLPPGQPAAVDMESAAWVRVAAEKAVPHVVFRSVLDPAEEDLPEFLGRCQDPGGGLSRTSVIREAIFHPRDVPRLLSMGRRVRKCAGELADCVLDVLSFAEGIPEER